MLTKQAKTLSDKQVAALVRFVESETRYPERNRSIVLLSYKAGLRSKEIALLRWGMLTDCEGAMTSELRLPNSASKGKSSGRAIPLHPALRRALDELYKQRTTKNNAVPSADDYVCVFQRDIQSEATRVQNVHYLFGHWYKSLGFAGASSHSGRRTFITSAAKKISSVGGSLRDVQSLAGHSSLQTTARYIEYDSDAVKKLVEVL